MPSFGESNHRKWKLRQAQLGLRLVAAPKPFVNPYPCALGLVPSRDHDSLRNLTPGQRAAEFVKRQQARTDDDPEAA